MASDVWGRARIPTGQSVAAALRLAKELRPDESRLCERENGATELLVLKSGEFRRYIAYEPGATEQAEVRERTPSARLARRVGGISLLCIPLVVVAGFVFKPQNSTLWIGGPLMVAFGLVILSAVLQKHHELEALVTPGFVSARIPYDLGGWEPRSIAQLAAVEELSKAGDSGTRVRRLSDGGVEVETFHKRQRHRNVLDARGAVLERDVSVVSGAVYWPVKLVGIAVVIPFAALWVFDDGARSFFVALAAYFLLLLVASRIDARKHLSRSGEEWFQLAMEPPSD
jgi:hypothetical protein